MCVIGLHRENAYTLLLVFTLSVTIETILNDMKLVQLNC